MAYKQVGVTVGGNIKEFQGLDTDTKPTTRIGGMSTFYETNTGKAWVFDELNINPVTTTGWWEV